MKRTEQKRIRLSFARTAAVLFSLALAAGPALGAQPKPSPAAIKPPAAPKVPIAPLKAPITAFVPFDYAPFPFRGLIPDSGKKFIDKVDGNRKGHVSSRDNSVHWEDEIHRRARS